MKKSIVSYHMYCHVVVHTESTMFTLYKETDPEDRVLYKDKTVYIVTLDQLLAIQRRYHDTWPEWAQIREILESIPRGHHEDTPILITSPYSRVEAHEIDVRMPA